MRRSGIYGAALMGALLFAAARISSAQDTGMIQAWCELDSPVTPFHRTATLTIIAEGPADLAITFPSLPRQAGRVEVTPLGNTNELLPDSRRRMEHRYRLDPIQVEQVLLPELTVKWGEDGETTLPRLLFTVRDLTESEREAAAALVGLQGVAEIAPPSRSYWGALAIAVLFVAAVLAWLWYRSRTKQEEKAPPKPPWEVALGRLEELEHRKLISAGKYGIFYVDLSAILRYYMEDRFNLHAPEQTTPEFLTVAQGSGQFSEDQEAFLREFLRYCDRVKFAQYEPAAEEMSGNLALVRQFVEATIIESKAPLGELQKEEAA